MADDALDAEDAEDADDADDAEDAEDAEESNARVLMLDPEVQAAACRHSGSPAARKASTYFSV
jgi:hypothetical protein